MGASAAISEDDLPFVELVNLLRDAGMAITPAQYAQFRRALALGLGCESGDDAPGADFGVTLAGVRRLARLLWVKPSVDYDAATFEQVFTEFQHTYARRLQPVQPFSPEPTVESVPSGAWPLVPPRQFPQRSHAPSAAPPMSSSATASTTASVPTAIAQSPTPGRDRPPLRSSPYQLTPRSLPVDRAGVRRWWTGVRVPLPLQRDRELDVGATIARMEREGADCEPVLRAVRSRPSQLVVFLDTSPTMIPFRPVLEPLLQAATQGHIALARVYRFTTVPLQVLYPWEQPNQGVMLDRVLSRLHRHRTIAVILSDAGAAGGIYSPERIRKTQQFLERLAPCVQQVLWLNPVPDFRWQPARVTGAAVKPVNHSANHAVSNSARAIATFLDGRMYALDPRGLQAAVGDRRRRFLPALQPAIAAQAATGAGPSRSAATGTVSPSAIPPPGGSP
jgi:uncharacterized protein with von Willebrand factor type A (vWA) domain